MVKNADSFCVASNFPSFVLLMNVPVSNVIPLKNLPLTSLIYSGFLRGAFEMAPVSLNTRILIDAILVN